MIYSRTLRTYEPSDCAAVGLHIRSNANCVNVTFRTRWQGTRAKTWILRPTLPGKGHELADEIYSHAKREGWQSALEEYGLDPACPDRQGSVIR